MSGSDQSPGPRSGAPSLDELSRAALTGSDQAIAALHARLTPGLTRHFVRKLGAGAVHSDSADELAQRTWIAFWEALRAGRYDPARARLTTFLYAVAHITWLRDRREAGRTPPPGLASLDHADGQSPHDAAELAASIDLVRTLIGGRVAGVGLSEDDRATLRAIADGRTDRELAHLLGVSPSTAHARKRAALARLAELLDPHAPNAPAGRAPHPGDA